MSVQYGIRRIGDITVLDITGRISSGITIADRLILHDLVRQQVNTGHNKILLNLREVTYIDSSGVGELFSSLSTVRNQGGQFRICNASERVGDLLRMTHLDSVLNFDKDESAALQAFFGDGQGETSAA